MHAGGCSSTVLRPPGSARGDDGVIDEDAQSIQVHFRTVIGCEQHALLEHRLARCRVSVDDVVKHDALVPRVRHVDGPRCHDLEGSTSSGHAGSLRLDDVDLTSAFAKMDV